MPATVDCYKTLGQTTLDIWQIPLNRPVQLDVLSDDELLRYQRYRFAADQRKFAVARSSLRHILADYTQQTAASLAFDYGPHGKPGLRDFASLHFNVSHSGEYALCGIAKQVVGLDIEQLRPMDRLESLIQRCLAPSEQQALAEVPQSQKSTAFLQYWTCKEAYLKATGQGISQSLTAIEVTLDSHPQLKVSDQVADHPWQLRVFIPCDGYTAAAVVPPTITQTRFWQRG